MRLPPPFALVAIGVGGTVGSLLRFWVGYVLDGVEATLLVNLLGAGILGLLTGWVPWQQRGSLGLVLQGFFAAGLLGGFTTYSTLAIDVLTLKGGFALAYASSTLVVGVGVAVIGLVLGRSLRRRRGEGR